MIALERALVLSMVCAAVVLAGVVTAGPASAEELGIVVERTTPSQKRVHLQIQSDRNGAIELRAIRLAHPEALLRAGIDLGAGNDLAWLGTGRSSTAALRKNRSLGVLRAKAGPEAPQTFRLRYGKKGAREAFFVRLATPGLYLLEARRGRVVARATALVSDMALVSKRHPRGAVFFAMNRRTGAPWPNVAIEVRSRTVTTDAQGLASIDDALSPTLAPMAMADGHFAFGAETYFPTEVDDRRVYAFTNQPAYRPGETVHVKGVVRAYENGAYALDPTATSANLTILDGSDAEVVKLPASIDAALGTFAASWETPESASTGDYTLVVDIGGDLYEAPFRLAAYRKPAFEVRVKARDARILAGGTTTFAIDASYYDGGALAGANVQWTLSHNRIERDLFPTDELVKLFFESEREAYQPTTLNAGQGRLDGKGRLTVDVEAPPERMDGYLTLRATVTGPDHMGVDGSGGLAVAAAPVRVGLDADGNLYGLEDIAGVVVKVERADGKPAAGRTGVLTVTHIAGATESQVDDLPVTTNAQGRMRLDVSLPLEGRYRFDVAVQRTQDEPAGPPIRAHIHVWAASDQPTVGITPGELDVIADKDHYAVGDTARLLVRGPEGGRAVLAALEGGTLMRHEVLTPDAGTSVWKVALTDAHIPNVYATFVTVYRGELLLETRMLRIPPARKLLTTTIDPSGADFEPGEEIDVAVRVTDAEGKPVANAEVAVAVVDDALHALYGDPGADIAAFFHATKRNNVSTGAFLHHDAVGYMRRIPPPKKDAMPPDPSAPVTSPAAPATAAGGAACGGAGSDDDVGAPGLPAEEPPLFGAEEEDAEEPMDPDAQEYTLFAGDGDNDLDGKMSARSEGMTVRKDFRTSALWAPRLRTDADGRASEKLKLADSLTRWRVSTRTVDAATRVGSAQATIRTRKRLSVRVTPPRFLRENDVATIPVLLRNLTEAAMPVRWTSSVSEDLGEYLPYNEDTLEPGATLAKSMDIEAARVRDVIARATAVGPDGAGDRVERMFPILPQGISTARGGVVAANRVPATSFRVPTEADPESIECRVTVESTYVHAIVNALPYLMDYPHGCTEQTMNRFTPLLDAQEAITALRIPVKGRVEELPEMLAAGLKRLGELQHADGGFGWWESDESSLDMTALVVRGLNRVLEQEPPDGQRAIGIRNRAVAWLQKHAFPKDRKPSPGQFETAAAAMLAGAMSQQDARMVISKWPHRLSPMTAALFLRVAHRYRDEAQVQRLRAALEEQAQRNGDLAFWGPAQLGDAGMEDVTWRTDPVQTTAEVLYALQLTGGDRALIDAGAHWLVSNRAGGDRWQSTSRHRRRGAVPVRVRGPRTAA